MTGKRHFHDAVQTIRWADRGIELIDQRVLPGRTEYVSANNIDEVIAAIADMVVRGAPAIGVTAAYGVAIAARDQFRVHRTHWRVATAKDLERLAEARPTAVNLKWAIERMARVIEDVVDDADPFPTLLAEAKAIHAEDVAANRRMGEYGASLIESGCNVLTHCNAGALATAGYGTALGVIRSAYSQGKIGQVFADETRPWLQGARLTAWELLEDGIPVSLIADGAATYAMSQGKIAWVIVGADRVAANGDVANKIGTYSLAVSARHHGVGFMVVAPLSTIDPECPDGASIPIEQRAETELLCLGQTRIAADGADAWNPVFDITPAALVDALVTDRGVVKSPSTEAIAALLRGDLAVA